ncbi:MAG: Nucleolar protein 58 [Thelocarpon superellum]|nr:MAG: Nucleolar protein 58 [Thelocarpon superellum]
MTLLILTETPAGYALLKARDKKLLKRDDLAAETETAEGICSLLKLKQFQKFDSAATALEEVSALVEGKVTPLLASLLDTVKDEKKVSLAVADPKLGNAINKLPSISLNPISDSTTSDLYRAIRNHLPSLIPGLLPKDIATMSLGLSHSLSRHKLKFSPDKVDTMIVQAIALLDDLDKELNTYAMRVKEWYGWHFPEMGKIVNDNVAYSRVILAMGMRSDAVDVDLAEILPEEIEAAVKAAAEVSMGTEITSIDLDNIKALASQVVSFTEYRQTLSSYLSARMTAIAPNLTTLVGELVGARLIAHAGSLMNLAKSPASTIQILGAEKALFRALKTKHDTPKYGLIYHASLIGQATGRNKGKIARMLATKAAIGLRVDALSDWSAHGEGKGDGVTEEEKSALGHESRAKIERRLRGLEGKPLIPRVAVGPNGKVTPAPGKWEVKEARKYNPDADGLIGDEPAAAAPAKQLISEKKASEAKFKAEAKAIKMSEEVTTKPAPNGTAGDSDGNDDSDEEEDEEEDQEGREDDGNGEEDEDEDEDMVEAPPAIITQTPTPAPKMSAATKNGDVHDSDTLSTVSDDSPDSAPSPTQQELNWQSSILGNTKVAKKARKKERHERKLATSEERSKQKQEKKIKLERRLDRKHRRAQKQAQVERRADRADAQFSLPAKQAGLSITRYKRKLERGEIKFQPDGTAYAISKKDIKKAQKEADKGDQEEKHKKRKREADGDDEVEVSEKKKKKKKKSKA